MFTQKYANNIRTGSGTVTIYEDDVTINCTTSSVACTVNLMEIIANHWSTQYKLYIIDASNNAATNNITIVAPTGFTINGAQTVTIATNGGGALIRIINNTCYIASFNYTSSNSGVAGHVIQDETISLTQRARLNFTGNLVVASDNAGTTTTDVTISQPYLYSVRLMQAATTYFAVVAAGIRSFTTAAQATTYDSKVESGITGFNITTGVWTVPTTGYYSVGAKLTTRLRQDDMDANTDNIGAGWMTLAPIDGGIGFFGIGILISRNGGGGLKTIVVCSDKQAITNNISDINIECTADEYPFQAGDLVSTYVINKTDHAVVGLANSSNLPDCYYDFSVKL